MRPGFDLSQYGDSQFGEQFNLTISCLSHGDEHKDLAEAVDYLRKATLTGGRPFYEFQVDQVRALGNTLNRDETRDLVDRWKTSYDAGKFQRLLDVLPFWVEDTVHGSAADAGGPAIRPLLDAVAPLAAKTRELGRLGETGAGILLEPKFAKMVAYAEKIHDHPVDPDPAQIHYGLPVDRIKATLRAKECQTSPTPLHSNPGWEDRRTGEVIDDYVRGIDNWELVDNKARRSWTREEFEGCLGGPRQGIHAPDWCQDSLFKKFSDKTQWNGDKSVAKATLNLLRYFTLAPGQQPDVQKHYSPEYLSEWFKKKSDDVVIIPYMYPGERFPRVRLVNTLDRLELILINADLDLDVIPKFVRDALGLLMGSPVPDNGAKYFLAMVGDAWGDEPREVWPLEIRNKYTGSSRPKTLREAYVEIRTTLWRLYNLLGSPDLPNCPGASWPMANSNIPDSMIKLISKQLDPLHLRAVLFNLLQVQGAIEEMLPDYNGPHRGSLKVLRDMFYEFHYSSPADGMASNARWKNNLSVILHLVKLGLGRQAGRLIRNMPADDTTLTDFFTALAHAAGSPHALPALETLLQKDYEADPNKLLKDRSIGKLFLEIFDLVTAPSAGLANEDMLADIAKRKCTGDSHSTLDEEWECRVSHMKQLSYYALTLLEQGNPNGGHAFGGQTGLMDSLVLTLKDVVARHKDYLGEHVDRIGRIISMKDVAGWARALYQDESWDDKATFGTVLERVLGDSHNGVDAVTLLRSIDESPTAHAGLELFADRFDALEQVQGYDEVKLEPWVRDVVAFFKEDDTDDCAALQGGALTQGQHTACKLRQFAAARLRAGDPAAYLQLIARGQAGGAAGPEQFYQFLLALSHQVDSHSAQSFLDLLRRSLSD
jgi:hypothetical protein